MNTDAFNHFNVEFSVIAQIVAFDAAWCNGTGYFNGVVRADLGLKSGDRAKAVADDGRRMILIGTPFGQVAVFEHHSAAGVLVTNIPSVLARTGLMPHSALNDDTLKTLIGYSGCGRYKETNIGTVLTALFAAKTALDAATVANPALAVETAIAAQFD